MKTFDVRFIVNDGVAVVDLMASILDHVPEMHGARILEGEDKDKIVAGGRTFEQSEHIATILAGDEEGRLQ